jgi:DNA invertase Pin-like site-specific DNA recombinase
MDTSTATGRMMLERQREEIAQAKRDGHYKGRAPTVRRQAAEIMRLMERGLTPTETPLLLGSGRASVSGVRARPHDGEHATV